MRIARSLGRAALSALGFLLLCAVLPAVPADARPGGGQNYKAPSRSSSPSRTSSPSYRSSSPSRNYSTPPSRRSTTYVPVPMGSRSSYPSERSDRSSADSGDAGDAVIGLLIFFAVIGLIAYFIWRRLRRARRATIGENEGAQTRGIAALKAQDPAFDAAAFAARTQATVGKVNEAWGKGQMGPARRLISDGVYVRFQTQLGLLRQAGLRNVMVDWRVVSANVLAAEADALWDTVHVKVVGEARDADVPLSWDDDKGHGKARSAPLSRYEEVWSFLRRRGKLTKAGVPALEGRCPNCGADLPLSDVVRCSYCQAMVNSGEHDWVLAEITQPEEWRVSAAEGEVPGLAELRQRDPAVSRQELEDRASVIFWKWIEARSTGKRDKLARFCFVPPANQEAAEALGVRPAKLEKVAVGSAEVQDVAQGEGLAMAHVEIRWSAGVDGAEPAGMAHILVLARAEDATSKRGLSSLDCPSCGGQLTESDAVTCTYCGEGLAGGKHEWALAGVSRAEEEDEEGEES